MILPLCICMGFLLAGGVLYTYKAEDHCFYYYVIGSPEPQGSNKNDDPPLSFITDRL